MHSILRILIFSLFIAQSNLCLAQASSNNPELENLRNTLPEKTLTLDLIISFAMKNSDAFKAVTSQIYDVPVAKLKANSIFDTTVTISQDWLNNQNEASTLQSPDDIKGSNLSLGVSKYFSTGTTANISVNQGHNKIYFPDGSFVPAIAPYYETKANFSLSQNLWADSFGYASRRALHAAELASEASSASFQSSIETWAINIISTYYNAWFSQAQTLAAQEGFRRRERLLKATQLRLTRGNAEKPDYLQIESAFLMSRVRKLEAEKNLVDQWRRLILLLKLPAEWLNIESTQVPIKIDNIADQAISICKKFRNKGVPADDPARLRAANLMYESAVLNWEANKNKSWPSLKLYGSYFLNGINEAASESSTETFSADHPGWSLGLSLSLPLEFSLQKAELSEATGKKMQAQALKNNTKDELHLSWLNECANLERLVETQKDAKKAFQSQNLRADLEEKRFRLGRSSTLNVIQAGDDETDSKIFLYATEVQLRLSAWKILEIDSQIVPKLKEYAAKNRLEFKLE